MSHLPWIIPPMSSPADQPAPGVGRDPSVAARVEQLYESHGALVRAVCSSLLRDRVEAEDAVQQTFLSAQRALLNGSSPRDEPAWLATIARHESLARVRARMREPLPLELEEREGASDTHAAVVRRHETGELRDALAELPRQQREAILLREMRGLSYQEVAAALSVTTSAVESLLFRARRSLQMRLREALASLSPGEWVQPLRELVARLAGGGLVAPAAAKVAAVGVGTAVVTGGAVIGPTVLGLGHAPHTFNSATRPPVHRQSTPVPPKPPAALQPAPASHPTRLLADVHPRAGEHATGQDSGSRQEASDRGSVSGASERERSGVTKSISGPTREARDDSSSRQVTSRSTSDSSTSDSPTTTTDTSSADFSSGTATAPPGGRDD
jgi:RNA polymerase sigma-70 factor (ECF subfamily)